MTKWANLSTAGKVWRVLWISSVVAFAAWFVIGLSVGSGSARAAITGFGSTDNEPSLGGDVRPLDNAPDTAWTTRPPLGNIAHGGDAPVAGMDLIGTEESPTERASPPSSPPCDPPEGDTARAMSQENVE